MADTVRTINVLLTQLFQDAQPAFSVNAQDMRDMIVTLAAMQNLTPGSLPTTLPATAGQLWINGGVLSVS